MNRRVLIIVSCALVLSGCASYLVYRAVGGLRLTTARPQQTIQLVVAARDLVAGTLVQGPDVKMAAWAGPLPKGAVVKRDGFLNRGVISAIYEGEPLTENRLAPPGSGGGLAATIPVGMRAVAVRVNDVVGVAGFVVAGMRVDVLITGLPPGGNSLDGPKVLTLLQDIQVLSAGTNFLKDKEGKPEQVQVINLLVTPAQAEILSLASNEMHIQLVLRNPMDTQISKPPGTIMSDLFGERQPKPTPFPSAPVASHVVRQAPPVLTVPAAPAIYTVEVSNGSVHTQAKFNRPPGGQ